MQSSEKFLEAFNKLGVDENSEVTLVYSDGVDVIHYTGEAEEMAATETDTIERLVDVALSGINFNENLVEDARDLCHLDDYERGNFSFSSHITEKIEENFYDYYDYINFETRQYDHKRGFTTVNATLTTKAGTLLEHAESEDLECLVGWKAEVNSSLGNVTIEL